MKQTASSIALRATMCFLILLIFLTAISLASIVNIHVYKNGTVITIDVDGVLVPEVNGNITITGKNATEKQKKASWYVANNNCTWQHKHLPNLTSTEDLNVLRFYILQSDNSSENYWLAEMPSDGGYQRHTESCGVAELKGSDKEIKWRRVKCAQSYLFICL